MFVIKDKQIEVFNKIHDKLFHEHLCKEARYHHEFKNEAALLKYVEHLLKFTEKYHISRSSSILDVLKIKSSIHFLQTDVDKNTAELIKIKSTPESFKIYLLNQLKEPA